MDPHPDPARDTEWNQRRVELLAKLTRDPQPPRLRALHEIPRSDKYGKESSK